MLRGNFETFTKRFVGGLNSQFSVEHQERWDGLNDSLGVVPGGQLLFLEQKRFFQPGPLAGARALPGRLAPLFRRRGTTEGPNGRFCFAWHHQFVGLVVVGTRASSYVALHLPT